MNALVVCIEEEAIQRARADYIANMLCMIARPNYETEIPLFSEMFEMMPKVEPMTAEEIYNHVMDRLDEYSGKEV